MSMIKVLKAHSARPAGNAPEQVWRWMRKNLFSSWLNTLLTLLCFGLMWVLIPPLLDWALFQANWIGETRADCTKGGACWVFIHERFGSSCMGFTPTSGAGESTLRLSLD
ncbi:Inner membrane amino-acid ABC transporter permease protein yhdY [Cedecea neteri]|uniref:Inner membrane amino-acid ABC transporter permease protein yhdY n=1 Tax=Cedecea neteri TaxID=158822 RepID=A0A2X2T1V3_9ENTR|nr:Inner membrane amino-acid ABC transporter permease protein yhdY [Cedecea neteri]